MKLKWLWLLLGPIVLIGFASSLSHAELAAVRFPPDCINMYSKGATPDPFPWGAVRPPGECCPVNLDGDTRGDRWPDFTVNLNTLNAEVTYSSNEPGDFEIAFVETNGSGWGPIILLTNNNADDFDPKLALSPTSGGTKIVYWRADATPKVFMIERLSPTGVWQNPQRVSTGNNPARYPTGFVALGKIYVGYEIDKPGQGKDIVISSRPDDPGQGGNFTPEIIAHSNYEGKAEATLDGKGSELWVSWVHSATQVGYSRYDGSTWSTPQFKPYSDPDDVQAVRHQIRREMLVGGN